MLKFSYHSKINIQRVLFFSNLFIFVWCAWYLGNYYYQGYLSESKIDDLRDIMSDSENYTISNNATVDVTEEKDDISFNTEVPMQEAEKREILSAYVKARENDYPHLVGRIKIEGTPIDYFVMQTPEDPEYYLYKDVMGEYNKEGTPFVDVSCDLEKPTNNIMIYGHAMKNQHQFGSLRKYKSEEYYKEHPVIMFETMYEPMCKYEIVSTFYSRVYEETDVNVFRYYYFFGTDNEKDFDYFIDNIKEIACYDTGIVPEFGDELLTLSTCNNENVETKDGRFVVVARKVKNDGNAEDNPDANVKPGEITYDELIESLHTDEPTPTSEPTQTPVENQENVSVEEIDTEYVEEPDVAEAVNPQYLEIDVSD